jgi:hypothetical protein
VIPVTLIMRLSSCLGLTPLGGWISPWSMTAVAGRVVAQSALVRFT